MQVSYPLPRAHGRPRGLYLVRVMQTAACRRRGELVAWVAG
jgi:hypothetical protein